MLTLSHISKHYDDNVVLNDIDLAIPQSQTTVLIGPSGCGKSTILRSIIGLIKPEGGDILYQGKPIDDIAMNSFRHNVGYVIQDSGLFPHLSAEDNITLMARYLDWAEKEIDQRLDFLLQMFQVDRELLQRFPLQLSGGQQQRVSLMRALMLDPEILLMDEPLAALDPMIRFDLQLELKIIFEKLNKTVVLVTHDIAEAAFFSDQTVLMRNGKIIQQGVIHDLLEQPAEKFVTDFINAQQFHWTLFKDKTDEK